MDKAEITEKVLTIAKDNLGVKEIKVENSLAEDLGADQLDIVELVMTLEEQFGIEIPDEISEKWDTISHVIDFIEEKING